MADHYEGLAVGDQPLVVYWLPLPGLLPEPIGRNSHPRFSLAHWIRSNAWRSRRKDLKDPTGDNVSDTDNLQIA